MKIPFLSKGEPMTKEQARSKAAEMRAAGRPNAGAFEGEEIDPRTKKPAWFVTDKFDPKTGAPIK